MPYVDFLNCVGIIINVLTVKALTVFMKGGFIMKEFDKERAHLMFHKMIQIDKLHRSVFEKMHSALGVHRSQHKILMYISGKDICPSQKDIAEHFDISCAAVAVSLRKLEEAELIIRESREGDCRFNCITLTEKGKEVVAKSIDFFTACDSTMFRDFSEQDYQNFDLCLKKMMEGLYAFSENFDKKI